MDSPLRTHPDLQAEATRRATEGRAACCSAIERRYTGEARDALLAGVSPLWVFRDAHLEMLLTDPDGLSRLLAARVGIVVGATAPTWSWNRSHPGTHDFDGAPDGNDTPDMWSLVGADDARLFVDEGYEADGWIVVPGISAILDPLQSLHAALVATEPRNA